MQGLHNQVNYTFDSGALHIMPSESSLWLYLDALKF